MPAKLQAITASAGAGKTTRIVRDIAAEVAARPPEETLATTFTIKAADELVERARAEPQQEERLAPLRQLRVFVQREVQVPARPQPLHLVRLVGQVAARAARLRHQRLRLREELLR